MSVPADLASRFQMVDVLREDARACVLCVQEESGEVSTLKIVRGAGSVESDSLATEFALFQGMQHPHLTRILEFGHSAEGVWLRREFVAGSTLAEAGWKLGAAERRRVLRDLLLALGHLHGLGILHLDIKPENVILRKTDKGHRGVLTDFGFASLGEAGGPGEAGGGDLGPARGTPPFIAPEVLLSLPRDGRADLFSLGVTWLVSGPKRVVIDPYVLYPRFPGAPFVDVMDLDLEALDPSYAGFLARVLENAPHDRPSSAAEALLLLDAPTLPSRRRPTRLAADSTEDEGEGALQDDPRDYALVLRPQPTFIRSSEFSTVEDLVLSRGDDPVILASVSCRSDGAHLAARASFLAAQSRVSITEINGEDTVVPTRATIVGASGTSAADRVYSRASAWIERARGEGVLLAHLDLLDAETIDVVIAITRRLQAGGGSATRLLLIATRAVSDRALPPDLIRASAVLRFGGLDVAGLRDHLLALEGAATDSVASERLAALASALIEKVGVDPEAVEWVLARELDAGRVALQNGRLDFAGVDPNHLVTPPSLTDELAALTPAERRVLAAIELSSGRLDRRVSGQSFDADTLSALASLVATRRVDLGASSVARCPRRSLSRGAFDQLPVSERRDLARRLLRAIPPGESAAHDRADLQRARLLALAGDADRAVQCLGDALGELRASPGESLTEPLRDVSNACEHDRDAHWRCLQHLARAHLLAGEVAVTISTYDQILEFGTLSATDRCTILCRSGSAHLLAGDGKNALAQFEQARRLMGRPAVSVSDELKFELDRGVAFARFKKGDPEGALRSLEGVLRGAREGDRNAPALKAIAGSFALRAGKVGRARELLDAALEEARGIADDELIAIVQTNRSTLLQREGRFDLAIQALLEALGTRSALGHRFEEALILNNLGIARREAGELKGAADALAESNRLRVLMGDVAGQASARANLALVEHLRGDLARAAENLDWAVKAFLGLGATVERTLASSWQAGVFLDAGMLAEAAEVLAGLKTPDAPRATGQLALAQAQLALEGGHLEAAVRAASKAARSFESANDRAGIARARLLLARAMSAGGDFGAADRALRDAKDHAPPRLIPEVLLEEGRALAARGIAEEALPALFRARDESRRLGLLITRIRAISELVKLVRSEPSGAGQGSVLAGELAPAVRGMTWPSATDAPVLLEERVEKAFGKEVAGCLSMNDNAAEQRERPTGRVMTEGIPEEVFRTFVAINRSVLNEDDLDRLLSRVLEHAVVLSGARRGFIVLLQEGRVVLEARSGELDPASEEISRTIVLDSIRQRRPLVTANARVDERLSGRRSIESLDLRSVLCVPFDAGKGIEGAIYVDNPIREGVFSARSVELLDALAGQAAIAIGNLERMREIGRLNDRLKERVMESERELHLARRELEQTGGSVANTTIVAVAENMKAVVRLAERVAKSELPVVVLGESGAGKEVLARFVHRNSPRSDGPFVAENCSAVPETLLESEFFGHVKGAFTGADHDREGLFQEADGGTLFLDEIGDMPASLQVKLLRVLQERAVRPVGSSSIRPVDIRLVCATHRDLEAMVREGAFREDLYYRIRGAVLKLPPLRDRRDDVPALADRFLARLNEKHGTQKTIPAALRRRLMQHSWPGNVRELESEVTRLYHLSEGDILDVESVDLNHAGHSGPASGDSSVTMVKPIGEIERDAILLALQETGGNREEAARRLQISRAAFYVKIKKYGLAEEAPPSRRRRSDPKED